MLTFTRANNAIYGSAFEQAIVNLINYCALYYMDEGVDVSFTEAANDYLRVEEWASGRWAGRAQYETPDEDLAGVARESVEYILGEFASDQEDVYRHAGIAANEILAWDNFSIDYPAQRIGSSTKSEDGDIRLANNVNIEVKYVKNNSLGTYNNMSMNAVAEKSGFQWYTGTGGYLVQNGWDDILKSILGQEIYDHYGVDCSCASPMSMSDSHDFRHAHPDLYKKIARRETPIRKAYVSAFSSYIIGNETVSRALLTNLLGKDFSGKSAPDYYLVFRRDKETCRIVDLATTLKIYLNDEEEDTSDAGIEEQLAEEPFTEIDESGEIVNEEYITPHLRGGCSIVYPGVIRMTFAWQNGSGLCNPTVRSFLLI